MEKGPEMMDPAERDCIAVLKWFYCYTHVRILGMKVKKEMEA